MKSIPPRIGLALVVCYLLLDDQKPPTGATHHSVDGKPAPPPKGLAICQYPHEEGFYLFRCDETWQPITDTWHASVLEALHQAELEHRDRITAWLEAAL